MKKLFAALVAGAAISLAVLASSLFGGAQIQSMRLPSPTGCTFIVETRADDSQVAFHAADCEKCQREREKP